MANKKIADYSAANSIDGVNDYLLIEPSGNAVYNKINRNVLLGLSSAPLGTSDSQSPTNKTFDNTNAYTIKDGSLTLQNTASPTKQATFSLSGITGGQTRVITLPDANATMVGTATTQTLTNKTITSPTITGGTIDNSTITVDAISGHSSATVVTVANLQISNGVLNSNNSVVTANITDGNVTPAKLVAGSGTGWALQSYTPTFAGLTVGNGTLVAAYNQTGKWINVRLSLVLGSTSSVSGSVILTLPVTSISGYRTDSILGNSVYNGGTYGPGFVVWASTTTAKLQIIAANSTYVGGFDISSSTPFTWGTGSVLTAQFAFEAA